jgi:hypothetical protein
MDEWLSWGGGNKVIFRKAKSILDADTTSESNESTPECKRAGIWRRRSYHGHERRNGPEIRSNGGDSVRRQQSDTPAVTS